MEFSGEMEEGKEGGKGGKRGEREGERNERLAGTEHRVYLHVLTSMREE